MNKSGTGLGLSICKQIIEQMGGSVKVESMLGVGTEFHIELALKNVETFQPISSQKNDLSKGFKSHFIQQVSSGLNQPQSYKFCTLNE